jgi:hypothetical protein
MTHYFLLLISNFSTITAQACITYFKGGVYLIKCRVVRGTLATNILLKPRLTLALKRRILTLQEGYASLKNFKGQNHSISNHYL